ncbi:hypothetical protein INR49_006355, partial [Caranx melampygus]
STDCICFATVGTNDPVTSALHIIETLSRWTCALFTTTTTFLRYSVSLLGYGFYGDVLTDSERKRWMGRPDTTSQVQTWQHSLKMFLTHHYYEGTVSYLPARGIVGTPRDATRCRSGERRRLEVDPREVSGDKRCQYELRLSSQSQGLSPAAHLADGTTDLILVRNVPASISLDTSCDTPAKMTRYDSEPGPPGAAFPLHARHCQSDSDLELDLLGNNKRQIFSQICRDHPACGCTPAYSSWNCDGEILTHTAIDVRVHCQLIKLFARGDRRTGRCSRISPAPVQYKPH